MAANDILIDIDITNYDIYLVHGQNIYSRRTIYYLSKLTKNNAEDVLTRCDKRPHIYEALKNSYWFILQYTNHTSPLINTINSLQDNENLQLTFHGVKLRFRGRASYTKFYRPPAHDNYGVGHNSITFFDFFQENKDHPLNGKKLFSFEI
jgi:hypothetical protein